MAERLSNFTWKNTRDSALRVILFSMVAGDFIVHRPSATDPHYFPWRDVIPFGPYLGNTIVSAVPIFIAYAAGRALVQMGEVRDIPDLTRFGERLPTIVLGVGIIGNLLWERFQNDSLSEFIGDAGVGIAACILATYVANTVEFDIVSPPSRLVRFE